MADHSGSKSQNFNFLGIGRFCKACKSLLSKRSDKHSSLKKPKVQQKFNSIDRPKKALNDENKEERTMNALYEFRYISREGTRGNDPKSPRGSFNHRKSENSSMSNHTLPRSMSSSLPSRSGNPSFLSRSTSRGNETLAPTSTTATLERSMSHKDVDARTAFSGPLLSRSATSRRSSMPIMYSNSNGLIKPRAIEKELECTLEELCFGCTKNIKITRNVVTNNSETGQEEETLTIKVKPGWRKGTKITFEGKENETPGTYPADITFVVSEKPHPLFTREGNDLELAIEVPLVEALTGCTVSTPLLGGEKMSLTIDDVIYPGYEKVIAGQGMPKSKDRGNRGNLVIKFLVEIPKRLTDEQRANVRRILQDTC